MIIRFVLIIQTIIYISNSDIPESSCTTVNPFHKSEHSCGDFNEVCEKRECHNLQAACSQCPPSNLTVSVLQHLKNLSTVFLEAFILCAIIILVLLFLDKSKSIDEKFERIINENNEKLLKEIKEVKEKHERSETIMIKNEKFQTNFNEVPSCKLRFQLVNQFDETELIVSKFDNVIKLKKLICDRNINMNDYKRMIMKYKGVTLDNNQYLLSCIDSTNIPIFCEFDNNLDVNAMIVIKLKCDNIYPEMIQIWKHQQIKDLKIMISKLNKTNHKDLLIFYKSEQLDDDDKTIDDYKIEDSDWIKVVIKSEKILHITMKSIFTAKETISIEFSKSETVLDIINKFIQKIQHKMATNHFALFLNNKLLQNDKFIYEYNIDSKSLVEFFYFKSVNEIENMATPIRHDHLQIFKTNIKLSKRPLLIKGYDKKFMKLEHNKDLRKFLEEDLQMFQITKYHSRFIHLIDIYMDDEWVYLGLDILTEVTLNKFLSTKEKNEISAYEISKWANQMLEGLKHLHNHNIIMKDMNPIDIYIDGNHDVKLPCFNLTEYLDHLEIDQIEYKHGVLTYIAPEILDSKPYEASVDVWSLGVIMIEIITRDPFFPGFSESQKVKEIIKTRTIKYNETNIPADLNNFIGCCMKGEPKERATIDQLMKHEFIEKYLL